MATENKRPIVLIVEDEVVTRHAAVEMVEEAGFDALEANDSARAMALLESVEGVGVVLTDVDMPSSIDGIKLAACIHRKWPSIGIIITSGKVAPKLGDIPFGGHFFAKPYSEHDVVAAIRHLLLKARHRARIVPAADTAGRAG